MDEREKQDIYERPTNNILAAVSLLVRLLDLEEPHRRPCILDSYLHQVPV